MSIHDGDCPSLELLRSCLLGELSDVNIGEIYDHLESCSDCQSRVDSLDDSKDPFLTDLRSSQRTSTHAALDRMTKVAEQFVVGSDRLQAPLASILVGQRIREYELLEQIGCGGMGTVFRARHLTLEREFAVKVLSPHRGADPHAVGRFHREIKAIGKLNHPNIVQPVDAGELGDVPYLVMELVDGADVAKIAQTVGPLRIVDACEICRQTTIGLEYVHDQGLIHRDIKPSNLILSRFGQVKILDLGLALLKHDFDTQLTSVAQTLGSLDYMAPEQALDSHTVGPPADIFSLGATLYFLLSGQLPSGLPRDASLFNKLKSLGERREFRIREYRPDLPDELVELLRQMLVTRPEDRAGPVGQIANNLEQFTADADLLELSKVVSLPPDEHSTSVPNVPASMPASASSPMPADHSKSPYAASRGASNAKLKGENQFKIRKDDAETTTRGRRYLIAAAVACGSIAVVLTSLTYVMITARPNRDHAIENRTTASANQDWSDASTANPPMSFPLLQKHGASISAIAFSSTGDALASADQSGVICVRDLPHQQNLTVLYAMDSSVRRLEFSADDKQLYALDVTGNQITFELRNWSVSEQRDIPNYELQRAHETVDLPLQSDQQFHLTSRQKHGRIIAVLTNGILMAADTEHRTILYLAHVFQQDELPTAVASYSNLVAVGSNTGFLSLLRLSIDLDLSQASSWRDYREYWVPFDSRMKIVVQEPQQPFRPNTLADWPEVRDESGYLVFRLNESVNDRECDVEYRLRMEAP